MIEASGITQDLRARARARWFQRDHGRGPLLFAHRPQRLRQNHLHQVPARHRHPRQRRAHARWREPARRSRAALPASATCRRSAATRTTCASASSSTCCSEIRRGTGNRRDEDLKDAFEIGKIAHKPMRTLSGGTRQKVSACVAFLFDPDVLVLDEPTAGLDPVSVEILKEKVMAERQEGKTHPAHLAHPQRPRRDHHRRALHHRGQASFLAPHRRTPRRVRRGKTRQAHRPHHARSAIRLHFTEARVILRIVKYVLHDILRSKIALAYALLPAGRLIRALQPRRRCQQGPRQHPQRRAHRRAADEPRLRHDSLLQLVRVHRAALRPAAQTRHHPARRVPRRRHRAVRRLSSSASASRWLLYDRSSTGLSIIATGVMLTFVFVAIAFLGAVCTRDKARGIGVALLLWFLFRADLRRPRAVHLVRVSGLPA